MSNTNPSPGFAPIRDGMSADDVWTVINDILDTLRKADRTGNAAVFAEVEDYVTNVYGDDSLDAALDVLEEFDMDRPVDNLDSDPTPPHGIERPLDSDGTFTEDDQGNWHRVD